MTCASPPKRAQFLSPLPLHVQTVQIRLLLMFECACVGGKASVSVQVQVFFFLSACLYESDTGRDKELKNSK